MNTTAVVLLATALGIAVGAGITVAITQGRAAGRRRIAEKYPELPDIAVSLLEEISTFAVILDVSLTPVYANPTARREKYITGEELRSPEFLRRARAVLRTGVPDIKDPDPDNPADTVSVHIAQLGPQFVVVLAEDLGEEQRLNAMRRDFIANVSHELKTPINAIGLLAEAVQEAADDPEMVRTFTKTLAKESRRLGELSRDIIHLSEAQSSLRPEDREPISLRHLTAARVEAHREYAMRRGVELVLTDNSSPELDDTIQGRAGSLAASLDNIIVNAINYSPAGSHVGVGIDISGGRLSVTVTDQGCGIAPEHLPRIFERFYRVDAARTRVGGGTEGASGSGTADEAGTGAGGSSAAAGPAAGGTGLGLSIARHSMRAHGGDIDVWSQVGVGSSFVLTFPLHTERRTQKTVKRARKALKKLEKQGRAADLAPAAQVSDQPTEQKATA